MPATARSILESPGVKALYDRIFAARNKITSEGRHLLSTVEGPDVVHGRRHVMEIYAGSSIDVILHVLYEKRSAFVAHRAGTTRRAKITVPIGMWLWKREEEPACPTT